MKSFKDNDTFETATLPLGHKQVSTKWIFKTKENPDGSLIKRKARLVARGFSQTPGVDFFETFSPVVRYESVRCVLSLAASRNMEMVQFDVQTAFLNGPIDEEIYLEQPEGYRDDSSIVWKLKKAVYGLKQAPRCWNSKFNSFLESRGFKAAEEDPCVYVRNHGSNLDVMCLYVDDGLLCSSKKSSMNQFLEDLESAFKVTINEPSVYVGMELTRNRDSRIIKVTQSGYIRRILARLGLSDAKPESSPLDPVNKLSKGTEEERFDCIYREAIGLINYCSIISRPDVTFAVNCLARFSNCPSFNHWKQVKRVARYLKGTISHGLVLGGSPGLILHGYSDSDWGSEVDERRSTSAHVFLLNNGPIAWSSSLQKLTSFSVLEAEYIALAEGLKECLWLKPFLSSIDIDVTLPTRLSVDNQAAIHLSRNPEFHKRTKHIGIRYHRIRQEQELGTVDVNYVPTDLNAADVLTKALGSSELKKKLSLIGFN